MNQPVKTLIPWETFVLSMHNAAATGVSMPIFIKQAVEYYSEKIDTEIEQANPPT